MNLEVFKNPDPSGMLSREAYVSKHLPEEYAYIIEYTNKLDLSLIPFKEKVYISINNLTSYPNCKNPNCNNKTKYKNSTLGYHDYCSNKCISSDPNMILHKEKLSLEKFGTRSPAQSNEIKEKIIKTNNKKYGGNSPMSNIIIQNKSKETLLNNYGVEHTSYSKELLDKRIKSFKKSNYKESYKKTSLKRYGVKHPWSNKEIHKKTIDIFYQDYKKRILEKLNGNVLYKFIGFEYNPTKLQIHCNECNTIFGILPYQFYSRLNKSNLICVNCYPISDRSSLPQMEIEKIIKDNYSSIIETNTRKVITPLEIDIYLPDLKLGIEFNGIYWHSSDQKDNNYHYNKYLKSVENNINLITIWEDDWVIKNELCKSFILNKIGKTPNKIYARKCDIKLVSYKDSREFLNSNHLQGDCKSSIRIGLYFNGELVSLMTFSKLRIALSQRNVDDSVFELTRFCNKQFTNVIGGASKIFRFFIKNNMVKEVHTYSDNMISKGDLYKSLGFTYIHTSKPGYWYVVNDVREHRFNWTKSKLVKMGYDSNKTEQQIMEELGYRRVYGSGNKKWIYYN